MERRVSDWQPARQQHPNPIDLPCWLRLGGQRRGERPSQRGQQEAATIHHSITRSARANRGGGTVRPRALAVLRLMTSSNLVGCSTGSSAGLAPFRILSIYVAARLYKSA